MAITKKYGFLLFSFIAVVMLYSGSHFWNESKIRFIQKVTGFVFPEGTKILNFRPRPFWEGRSNWFDLFFVLPKNCNPAKLGLELYAYDPAYTNDWALCFNKKMDIRIWDMQRQIFGNPPYPLHFLRGNKTLTNTRVEAGTNLLYSVNTIPEGHLFLVLIDTMNGNTWLRLYTGD